MMSTWLRSDGLCYASELAERGWTRTMVTRFAGPPARPTVRRPSGTVQQAALWEIDHIVQVEATPEFVAYAAKTAARRAAGVKAAETRRDAVVEWAETCPITLDVPAEMTVDDALKRGFDSWRGRQQMFDAARGRYTDTSWHPNMDRLAVNWLRHRRTRYDARLVERSGTPGVDEARSIIRDRVLDLIAARFPALADECDAQRR